MQNLIENISIYITLNNHELQLLKEASQIKKYKKKEMIFKEGRISDEIYFVLNGCVRLFYNADGNDKTAFFYTEGQFICAGESFTYNVEAKENYQAVEDTELIIFTKKRIEELTKKVPKMEVIARVATENELITCQRVLASFITKTAEERYLELLENNKPLFQRVPQQYIASFLGVSPETLSRIKARVYQKENS